MRISVKTIAFAVFVLTTSILTISSLTAFAKSTIYKCKDERGRIVFSQQAACEHPEMVNYGKKKLADKLKEAEEKKQQEALAKQQKQCRLAKATLKSYQRAGFLTKTVIKDGKSIKVRLTEEEVKQAIDEAREEVAYWCDELEKDK